MVEVVVVVVARGARDRRPRDCVFAHVLRVVFSDDDDDDDDVYAVATWARDEKVLRRTVEGK